MNNFADRLNEKVKEKGNPCIVTLDFYQELLPENVLSILIAVQDNLGLAEKIASSCFTKQWVWFILCEVNGIRIKTFKTLAHGVTDVSQRQPSSVNL